MLKTIIFFVYEKIYNSFNHTPAYSPVIEGSADGSINLPNITNPKVTGFMHCHLNDPTKKDFAIFTPDDFIALNKQIANSNALMTNFTMYVTSNIQGTNNTYAVKITDIAKFNTMATHMEIFYKQYRENWNNNVKVSNLPNIQVNEFLKIMKSLGVDDCFELYQCDSNLANWEQLKLNDSSITIKVKC